MLVDRRSRRNKEIPAFIRTAEQAHNGDIGVIGRRNSKKPFEWPGKCLESFDFIQELRKLSGSGYGERSLEAGGCATEVVQVEGHGCCSCGRVRNRDAAAY